MALDLQAGQVWEHPETGNRITIEAVGPLKVDGTLWHRDFPAETGAQGIPFLAFEVMTLISDPVGADAH